MDDLFLVDPIIFIDEGISGLMQYLAEEMPEYEYTSPGLLPEVVRGTEDQVWIRVVGEQGMIAITKDRTILRTREELQMIIRYQSRIILLVNTKGLSSLDYFEQLSRHWVSLLRHFYKPGPWVIKILRDHKKGSVYQYLSERKLQAILDEKADISSVSQKGHRS